MRPRITAQKANLKNNEAKFSIKKILMHEIREKNLKRKQQKSKSTRVNLLTL
jgi:hypothetical protein